MSELKDTGLSVYRERALLMGTFVPGLDVAGDERLEELQKLAETAGADVVEKIVQKKRPEVTYYVGRGKAEEITALAKAVRADVIISDKELTSAQVRNLEELTGIKVIDRTELILDIFATHARTNQAKLQVELAQLEYTYPRLKNLWGHFSRFEGGIGVRGPGEQQLEVDRRLIRKRIDTLKQKLRDIERRKERQVKHRSEFLTICIVGYTNAGKSTLMNALTDAGMLVEDKLFATLDTRTRILKLPGCKREILLSDTVGFIRRIPHYLVASFHATLEELTKADVLLHVVDVSQYDASVEVMAVQKVLAELGCHNKRQIQVFNKMDAVRDRTEYDILKNRYTEAIEISALRGEGIEELREAVKRIINEDKKKVKIKVNAGSGKFLAFIFTKGDILTKNYLDSEVIIEANMEERIIEAARRMDERANIEILS